MQTYCGKCNATIAEPISDRCPACQADRPRWGWAEDPRLGQLVAGGQYRVVRRVGAGGFGIVYEVRTVVGDLRRALKVLSPEWSANEAMRDRFVNEAVVLERVNHVNVGRCYAAGRLEDDGALYLLLELVQGRSLREIVQDEGPIEPERAVPIARQISSGLVAAHANGVLHRDLKPDNILIVGNDGSSPRVKVVDFGVAKFMDQGEAVTMNVVGTPQYMAPEQFTPGVVLDARVDVWQLGATLFAMLTGEAPYALSSEDAKRSLLEQHASHTVAGPRPSSRRAELAEVDVLDTLVSRMLASDPERRPKTAAEVCEILARIEHGLSPDGVQTSSLALLDTLCAQAGDTAWWSLCRFIQNRGDDQAMLVSIAEQRLRPWPLELRRASLAWWEMVRRGESHPLWPLVRSLDLSGRPLSDDDVRQLAACPACASLQRLELARCGIGNEGAAALARSPHLRGLQRLGLSGNRITSAGATALAQSISLGSLTSLDLAANGVGARGAQALSNGRLALESLCLADNDVQREGALALANGTALRSIKHLSLAGNALGSDGAAAIATSSTFSGLQEIDLSRNALGPGGAAVLALAPLVRGTRRLVLANNGFGQQGIELFMTSVRSEVLEELDLSSNQIDASGAMVLTSSPFARRLRRLELSDNNIDDAGLVLLLGAAHLSGLQHLGVAQNSLTEAGLKLLTGAPPRLQTLDISHNPIGAGGATALASALPRTRVSALHMRGSGLDGEGVAQILRAAGGRIRELDISSNALLADGIEAVAHTPELSAVTRLTVGDNGLGHRGAGRLATSPFATGLRHLSLRSNEIGDGGLELLSRGADNLPMLESLDLADDGITARGVAAVAAFRARLSTLDLSYNELGDAGVEALARAGSWLNLHQLSLARCRIGFGGLAVLLSAPALPFVCSLDVTQNALAGEVDFSSLGRDRVTLLETTFAHVMSKGADIAERFYDLLFERYPQVKPLFANVSMAAQRRHLTAALAMTVDGLRDSATLERSLAELGRRHSGYGVALTHYFAVTTTLLDVLKEAAGDQWTKEVAEGWYDGLDAITSAMMRGHRGLAKTEVDRLDTVS